MTVDGGAAALVGHGSSCLRLVFVRSMASLPRVMCSTCATRAAIVARGIAEADSDVLELAAGRRQDGSPATACSQTWPKPAIHRDNLIVFA